MVLLEEGVGKLPLQAQGVEGEGGLHPLQGARGVMRVAWGVHLLRWRVLQLLVLPVSCNTYCRQ